MTPRHPHRSTIVTRLGTARNSGFTLVELLIALALVGLLTVMLVANIGSGMRIVTAATTTLDRSSEIALAYGFLRDTLGNIQSIPDPDAPLRTKAILFDGAQYQLEFATMPPAYLAPGGLYRLRLSLDSQGSGRRLIVAWQVIARGMATGGLRELAPSVLVDGIDGATFSYCCGGVETVAPSDDRSAGGLTNWGYRWPNTAGIPSLIRLHLSFSDGWQAPDLLVAPRQANLPSIRQ